MVSICFQISQMESSEFTSGHSSLFQLKSFFLPNFNMQQVVINQSLYVIYFRLILCWFKLFRGCCFFLFWGRYFVFVCSFLFGVFSPSMIISHVMKLTVHFWDHDFHNMVGMQHHTYTHTIYLFICSPIKIYDADITVNKKYSPCL